MEFNQQLYKKRQRSNAIGLTLSLGAMVLGLFVLLWILSVLLSNGFAALDWNMFTQSTPAPGSEGGGLANAIVGSLMMVGFTVLVSTPIGVLAGVYLAEYGDQSKTAELTRFVTDIMLSAPSIVLGLFVYAIAVATVGNFSGWAGSLALSLIAVPVVVRTTENMLRLVPGSLREAAFALGAPRWKVSTMVTLRAARSGVMTGLLLAVARISGETAPLLFTALNNQFFSTNMNAPMANLPVVIFQFALSPYENWVRLAWGVAHHVVGVDPQHRGAGFPAREEPCLTCRPITQTPPRQPPFSGFDNERHRYRHPQQECAGTSQPQLLLWQVSGAAQRQPQHCRAQGDCFHWPLGLWQVHPAADFESHVQPVPGPACRRHHQLLRPGHPGPQAGHQPAARPHRHGVPETHAVSHVHLRQHRLRCEALRKPEQKRDGRPRGMGALQGRLVDRGEGQAAPKRFVALRRTAAAPVHCTQRGGQAFCAAA